MMATSTSPSWPPDPPVSDGLTAKSSTLVQFAVGACMVFVQHLVQRLIGFGGLETERALAIGNLVPALLAAFGGMRLGIGSTPPILHLDPVVDSFVSSGFDLTWEATEGLYSRTHSDFGRREETAMGMFFVAGCLVLAVLAGAWIIRARISVIDSGTNAPLIPTKDFCTEEGSKGETGNGDPARKDDDRIRRRGDSARHGDERRANDSDDDSDDDDPPPPPPPGNGTDLHHDDDRNGGEDMDWKHLGVTFVLGYLVAAVLKVLRKWKTASGVPRRYSTVFGVNEHIRGTDYGKEWDVLEGTYGFSRSKSNEDVASRRKTEFRFMVGVVPFAETQNLTIPDFDAHNPVQEFIWAGMSKVKATVEKAKSKFDPTQSMVAIQICLVSFLVPFGLADFVVLIFLPLIISILRYRFNEQDAGAVAEGATQGFDYKPLTEAHETRYPPNRREDDEDFVYLDQRVSAPNESANGDIPELINISTPSSSPRRSIERYATHYSELAEFIVRHDACKLNGLEGGYERDVCVEFVTEEVGNSEEGTNTEPVYDTTWTLIKDYPDETATEFTSFGSGDVGEEPHTTDAGLDSEWSSGEDLDKSRGSITGGEFEDAQELPDDLSDIESYYATACGSDEEMEVGTDFYGGAESLYEPCSDPENTGYIDDDHTEDELNDPIRLVPGSFPVPFQPQMLGQIPIWGTRSNRWSIFAQFGVLREGQPLLASEAIDFGLPRSRLNVNLQTTVAADSFQTPTTGECKDATEYSVYCVERNKDEIERKRV